MKAEAIALIILAVVTVSLAQTPPKKPAFEVFTVKLNTSIQGTAGIGDQPGGRFVANRVPLRRVIQFAYRGHQDFIGGPDWIDTDRWDIEAKAAEGTVPLRASPLDATRPDTLALMVQSLLEERFKFMSHAETRELPLYNLTVSKGGAKVKLSEDQTPPPALAATGAAGRGPGRGGIRLGRGEVEAKAQSMDLLATALGALYAGRPVVDKTGLKGLYDIQLRWTPNADLNTGANQPIPAITPGVTLFDALDEQLGLKLESSKGQLPVLVIDRVERPSEN